MNENETMNNTNEYEVRIAELSDMVINHDYRLSPSETIWLVRRLVERDAELARMSPVVEAAKAYMAARWSITDAHNARNYDAVEHAEELQHKTLVKLAASVSDYEVAKP